MCREPLRLAAPPSRVLKLSGGRARARCRARGGEMRVCSARLRARSRRRVRTIAKGRRETRRAHRRVTVRMGLTRTGKRLLRRHPRLRATLELTAGDGLALPRRQSRRLSVR